jgi:hypothetical protein
MEPERGVKRQRCLVRHIYVIVLSTKEEFSPSSIKVTCFTESSSYSVAFTKRFFAFLAVLRTMFHKSHY